MCGSGYLGCSFKYCCEDLTQTHTHTAWLTMRTEHCFLTRLEVNIFEHIIGREHLSTNMKEWIIKNGDVHRLINCFSKTELSWLCAGCVPICCLCNDPLLPTICKHLGNVGQQLCSPTSKPLCQPNNDTHKHCVVEQQVPSRACRDWNRWRFKEVLGRMWAEK